MPDPKVTVSLMTRSRPHYLKLAMASILAQEGVELQLLILDNASTDNTREVVQSFDDPRIAYLRSETDIGMVRNWNRAIHEATERSDLVSIFHDDDLMLPGFLAESTRALLAHPSAGMSASLTEYIDDDGAVIAIQRGGDLKEGLNHGLDFLELIVDGRATKIPPPVVLFRSDVLRRIGPVDSPHARASIDVNCYFRVTAVSDLVYIPKLLAQCRAHAGSETTMLREGVASTFWYAHLSERVDVISYLLKSPRAADAGYRQWLSERLAAHNAHQSAAVLPIVPKMHHAWEDRRIILCDQIDQIVPPGEPFILVDDLELGLGDEFRGRRVSSFLEINGAYGGAPYLSSEAIDNLKSLRTRGLRWVVIGWPAFWWMDEFGHFRCHLENNAAKRQRTPHAIFYELKPLDSSSG